jgi:hypothetical protein
VVVVVVVVVPEPAIAAEPPVALPDIDAEPLSPEPVTVVVTVAEPPAEPVVVVVVTDIDEPMSALPAVSSAFFFLQPVNMNAETSTAIRMDFFIVENLLSSLIRDRVRQRKYASVLDFHRLVALAPKR